MLCLVVCGCLYKETWGFSLHSGLMGCRPVLLFVFAAVLISFMLASIFILDLIPALAKQDGCFTLKPTDRSVHSSL